MTGPEPADRLCEHATAHGVPGAALGVLRAGVSTTAVFGVQDITTGDPVTPETRFAVGSLTKSTVATAIARLAAQKCLSLDDSVAGHVPELRSTPWAERATVRDLMANRSRLPLRESTEFPDLEGDEDGALSRYTAQLAGGEPTGAFWSYSNAGWCVLARVIETVTGRTWEDAMQAEVFDPLAMSQTTFTQRPAVEPRATGHTVTAEGPVPVERWTPRALAPAGTTLLSTVADMLRLATAHLEDPALARLRTVHSDVRVSSWLDRWCLGWARFDWAGGPVWGWDGLISGDRAILRLLPDRNGAVVLLANGSTGRAVYRSLFPELLETYFGVTMPALRLEPSADAAGALARFEGVYAWPDRRLEVTATGGALVLESAGTSVDARPLDECTFLVDADDPDNPTVTFGVFDESGRPGVLYDMLWGLPRV
jgi:CubicO group peptidase (beta-lactamase class C family)